MPQALTAEQILAAQEFLSAHYDVEMGTKDNGQKFLILWPTGAKTKTPDLWADGPSIAECIEILCITLELDFSVTPQPNTPAALPNAAKA